MDSSGIEGNGSSTYPAVCRFGRVVAFSSNADNLVPGDTNNDPDIFIHILATGETRRVSVSSTGTEGDKGSYYCCISKDGQYVAFNSHATNLVPGDGNWYSDLFVYEVATGLTTRVSVNSAGEEANGSSSGASISGDGRYVAFCSGASNLVAGDENGCGDIFVRDRVTGVTERVSVNSTGEETVSGCSYPDISPDGRYVAFHSSANNLAPGDTNGCDDIFVHDRNTGNTVRVSVDSVGVEGNGDCTFSAIASNGRTTFYSAADNLVAGDTNGNDDIFVHDMATGVTTCASVDSAGLLSNGGSMDPDISENGRFVIYMSNADNLVPGDTNSEADTFVHDMETHRTFRVSVDSTGAEANDYSSYGPSISPDGHCTVFSSRATNLVPGDTNGYADIFLHSRFSLLADTYTVPEAGGTVNFTLDAGTSKASRNYLLVGGVTGIVPGFPLPGGVSVLPVNWDAFTDVVMFHLNSVIFSNFASALDLLGTAAAQLNMPALPPGLVGIRMYYAFCLGWPWEFVSNPVEIEVVN